MLSSWATISPSSWTTGSPSNREISKVVKVVGLVVVQMVGKLVI